MRYEQVKREGLRLAAKKVKIERKIANLPVLVLPDWFFDGGQSHYRLIESYEKPSADIGYVVGYYDGNDDISSYQAAMSMEVIGEKKKFERRGTLEEAKRDLDAYLHTLGNVIFPG
jgi:hypothetical protein